MDHIDEFLTTAAIGNDYPLAIRAALAIGKKTLNRYYDKSDQSEVFRIAMGTKIIVFFFPILYYLFLVLHPRHKLAYFKNAGWHENWIKRADQIVRTQFEASYGSMDESWASQDPKVCIHLSYFSLSLTRAASVGQRLGVILEKYLRQSTCASSSETCRVT